MLNMFGSRFHAIHPAIQSRMKIAAPVRIELRAFHMAIPSVALKMNQVRSTPINVRGRLKAA